MNFLIVAKEVGILSVIMLIGFLIVKLGYVASSVRDGISKIIVKLVLPALIISSISEKTFEIGLIKEILYVSLFSFITIFILFLTGTLTAKLMKIPEPTATVHRLVSTLGNVTFIGYPIVVSLYGEEGFFYLMFYWLINDLLLWTVGVIMFDKGEKVSAKDILKKFINPNTVSFVIGLLMFIFGIKLPPVINEAVGEIASVTIPLSMIFVGMSLALVNPKNVFKKWWIFVVAPLKLLIMPLLFILLYRNFIPNEMMLGVVIIESAVPVQTVLTILSYEKKSDYEYASVALLVTTLMSIVTLPVVSYFIEVLI